MDQKWRDGQARLRSSTTGLLPFAAPFTAEFDVRREPGGSDLVVRTSCPVVASDPHLAGHFPGRPLFPGVFVLELVRQAAAVGLGPDPAGVPEFHSVRSARLLAPIEPGDVVVLEVTVGEDTGGVREVSARAVRRRDGQAECPAAQVSATVGCSGAEHA